jgi:hypothetical protein
VGLKEGVGGDLAREVVIEITHPGARRQQAIQGPPVFFQGDVQRPDLIAGLGRHPRQEADIPLDPGHQDGVARVLQAQLLQGAEAIGIAVEDIKTGHGGLPRRLPPNA